jgi:hypothetical protein
MLATLFEVSDTFVVPVDAEPEAKAYVEDEGRLEEPREQLSARRALVTA